MHRRGSVSRLRPSGRQNSRTPKFDLDSVYGGGPTVSPAPLRSRRPGQVPGGTVVGSSKICPAAPTARPLVADPRNDENLIIAGLQCAFHARSTIGWSTTLRRQAQAASTRPPSVRDRARQIVTWHYQWIILNEFLPPIVGAAAGETTSSLADAGSTDRGWATRRSSRSSSRVPRTASGTA